MTEGRNNFIKIKQPFGYTLLRLPDFLDLTLQFNQNFVS